MDWIVELLIQNYGRDEGCQHKYPTKPQVNINRKDTKWNKLIDRTEDFVIVTKTCNHQKHVP